MIKLRNFLFDNVCLVLTEDNSGYTSHILHKHISDKLFNCWIKLLNEIENKTDSIENIGISDQNYFKKQIDDGNFFDFDVSDPEINMQSKQRVNVLLAFIKEKENVIINGAITNIYSNPIDVYLQINPLYSVNQILEYKDYIEELAHHETVHIIKFIQKLYQISMNRYELDYKNQEWYNKYLLQTQEIHANVAQLNNELKHIKLKYPNINFNQAVNQSKIFRRYKRDIFINNPKLKNKMLSKIANYWNKL